MFIKVTGSIDSSIDSIVLDNVESLKLSKEEKKSVADFINILKSTKEANLFAFNSDFNRAITINYSISTDNEDQYVELISIDHQEESIKNMILDFIDLIKNKSKK